MIPAVGTGFLPMSIATPPQPVALPVEHVATYASTPGAAPLTLPLLDAMLTVRQLGDARADGQFGLAGADYITVVSLRRDGVYNALLVDAIALDPIAACGLPPDSIYAPDDARPVSMFVAGE
ncbi:MAG: hypothetical protein ABJA80_04015 [bacterium]